MADAAEKTEPRARELKLKIEYRSLTGLKLDPQNARLHSDAQIEEIAKSIKRFGFVNPILIRRDGMLIAGEGRFLAAKRMNLKEVPLIELAGLSDAQARALALADNKIASNSAWDEEMLRVTLEALKEAGEETHGLGFADAELTELMAELDGPTVGDVETGPIDDEFWISIRGPLKDQAAALKQLQTLMAGMPQVAVELGTISLEE